MLKIESDYNLYTGHPMVGMVAANMAHNLGERALPLTYRALERMRASHNEEGMTLWLAIHARLLEVVSTEALVSKTIH